MGSDRVEFYIQRGFVSRLSTPLNALVNGWSRESLEGCVSWEDIDTGVFSRFAQYLYTGDYTGFTPVENEHMSDSGRANTITIEATWNGHSSERSSLFPTSATTQPASIFGSTAPSEDSQNNDKADPFKMPYSLRSYERAAAKSIHSHTHALRCKVNRASSQGAKCKADAEACDCIFARWSSSLERKRDFIWAFIKRHTISRFTICQNMYQIKPGPQTKNFELVFIGHAKIWAFAAGYSIDSLTDLACAKLAYELSYWTISESAFIPGFGGLVRYVYSNCMTADGQLRRLVAEFAACVVEDVCSLEGWSVLLNEVPDFAADLVKQMTNRMGWS